MSLSADPISTAQLVVAALLLGLSLLTLPLALGRALRFWWPGRLDAAAGGLLGAMSVAAVLRFFVAPLLIATVFIGYRQTTQAIALVPLPHYGAGAAALYHALFALFPADHVTLMWTNSVLGVLLVPLLATVTARLFHDRAAGVIAAALYAFVPLFIRNDNSDANNVPCLVWLFAGLTLWEQYLEHGARWIMAAAFSLFALAAIGRPEMPLLVPLFALALTFGAGGRARPFRDPLVYVGALATLALLVPHGLHVFGMIGELRGRDSLPGFTLDRLRELPMLLRDVNVLIDPTLFPVTLLGAAALALVLRGPPRGRLAALALWLLVPIAFVVYVVDLDRANMARVEVPAALLVTMLAAAALARIGRALPSPWIRVPIALGVFASFAPSVPRLWAPTNEAREEELIAEARRHLPKGPFTFVRLGHDDAKDEAARHTHLHFPDYWLTPPRARGRAMSVEEFGKHGRFDAPAFFFWGFRCYARWRIQDERAPAGDNLQPGCARMGRDYRLEPVFEHVVPNRGDVWLEYYGTSPTLRVGLYRIHPKG